MGFHESNHGDVVVVVVIVVVVVVVVVVVAAVKTLSHPPLFNQRIP